VDAKARVSVRAGVGRVEARLMIGGLHLHRWEEHAPDA
jgi:hypothetical protein